MTVIVPVNTQQVLQMGPLVERVQQVMQAQHTTTAQQLDAERIRLDESRREEVIDPGESHETEPTNPERHHRRKWMTIRTRHSAEPDKSSGAASSETAATSEEFGHGGHLDLTI